MATKAYQLNKFIRVHDYFQEFESIQRQNRAKTNTKITEEAVDNVKNFLQEYPRTSLRKSSQVSCTKTTLWRNLRKDLRKTFYRYISAQPLTDA